MGKFFAAIISTAIVVGILLWLFPFVGTAFGEAFSEIGGAKEFLELFQALAIGGIIIWGPLVCIAAALIIYAAVCALMKSME